ncbi:hypothetical protein ES703_114560 [subsurface metagenome]
MLRKSKKGFTLIELMVVVVIIGVLAVMGLRFYSGQVEKAKNAVIKANVGTIQTLIQAELADRPITDLDSTDKLSTKIFAVAGIHNPVDGSPETELFATNFGATSLPVGTAPEGMVIDGSIVVHLVDNVFYINGNTAGPDQNWVFTQFPLTAIK